jgi:signal transduction histidine kinase
VDEINQTLDDLLFWSKSQLQGITSNPSSFDASEVIKSVMTLSEEIILKKGIQLTIDYQTSEMIWCDVDHLTIVIRNLIQNAIKFTPKGQQLAITTSSENNMICISIADTGKGMDETTLKNLREGMIVESYLGTAGEVGTGLGLSLVSEMVSKNNGKMEVKSQLGVGTEITILIPKAK